MAKEKMNTGGQDKAGRLNPSVKHGQKFTLKKIQGEMLVPSAPDTASRFKPKK